MRNPTQKPFYESTVSFGGWGVAPEHPSEFFYTALSLLVLKDFQMTFCPFGLLVNGMVTNVNEVHCIFA